jgi:cysteine-rich repeat protein
MLPRIKTGAMKNKKGVSEMVGYVLLITLAVTMSIIAYNWMKTYLPKSTAECPDGTSLFIEQAMFNASDGNLSIALKNNGRFDIAGYLIFATNSSSQTLATIDLSPYLNKDYGGTIAGNSVLFAETAENSFAPDDEASYAFDIPPAAGSLYSVRVTPVRFEKEGNREEYTICTNSPASQIVGEAAEGPAEGPVCGNGAIETGETCDDSNTASGDGCSSSCAIESGWTCSGTPSVCLQNQVGIGYFGFESGSQGWNDPGSDSDRTNARSKVTDTGANGGTYSWHLQSSSPSSYTQQNFNFAGYSQVKIEWWGYYSSLESWDHDCLELKIDGVKADSWGSDSTCNHNIYSAQNTWLAQSVTLSSAQYAFDSSVQVRFEGEMSSSNDEFYFDGVNITGIR